ncbi:MAG TPA: hypothetical protein VGJ73_10485, partial [Verrucomicrobiae bacterium]
MASNACFLTAIYTCAQVRRNNRGTGASDIIDVTDASLSVIVFSASPDEAQRLFENALCEQSPEEGRKEITIRKFYAAPIVGQLLTESGNLALAWPKILENSDAVLESTPVDDFEQGYWVDVDKVVPSHNVSLSVGTIESNVPDDVRSSLNWSGNKQFFFLLKVLPLPPPPSPPTYEQEVGDVENELSGEPTAEDIQALNAILPDTVAVIQARNSVAAAWLWR